MAKSENAAARAIPAKSRRARTWAGKLALAILSPLILFSAIELGLRAGGFGRRTDFFIPDERPGEFRTNPRFTELYFPASFGLKPLNFRLARRKAPGVIRIFVVGESAAMGVPEPGFGLAPQLRAQLRAMYPEKHFEVCNLGVTAINSHVIRDIVGQAVEFEPDLLVFYMGNNEVVGPFGPSAAVAGKLLTRPLIHARLWLSRLRVGQLVAWVEARAAAAGKNFKDWRGMEMFAGNTVAADDPRLRDVYDNFAANLADMLEAARRHGVRVLLSTVAVNVREHAPFASLHAPTFTATENFERARHDAEIAEALGDSDREQAALGRAIALDPMYADAHFQLARFLERQRELPAARQEYLRALQLDALRFRADARINELIRAAAKNATGTVTLVDAARELGSDAESTAPPPGHEYFFEHVHLTFAGNEALARTLVPTIEKILFDGEGAHAPLNDGQIRDAMGYTAFAEATLLQRMEQLTARPPFTGQSSFADDRAWEKFSLERATAATNRAEALSGMVSQVDSAVAHDPENSFLWFHSALLHARVRDFVGGLERTERAGTLEPRAAEFDVQRAFFLLQLHRGAEAETELLHAAAEEPYYFQIYGLLAQAWGSSGKSEQALSYFRKLVDRMPGSRGVRLGYAQILEATGNSAGAEEQWRAVLSVTPDAEDALGPLLDREFSRKNTDGALASMLRAFAYNPRDYLNNERLVAWYDDHGDVAATAKFMQALEKSGPVNAALHFDLATRLRQLGLREDALAELARARKAAQIEGNRDLLARIAEIAKGGAN